VQSGLPGLKTTRKILFALLIAIPAGIVLLIISKFAVNVPFSDDWTLVTDIQKLEAGDLTVRDLLAQHAEHRMLFPRLLMLGLASISRWNILYELYTSWIFIVLSWLMMWSLLHVTLADQKRYVMPLAAIQSLLLFSLTQCENFIWGWGGIQWFFSNFAAVASIWSLVFWKGRWIGILISAFSTLIATYSIATGQLLWVLLLFLILDKQNWKREHIYFWFVAGACAIGRYFYDFTNYTKDPYTLLRAPVAFLQFVFICLGRPFATIRNPYQFFLSAFAGSIGFLLFAGSILWIHKSRPELFSKIKPWLVLAAYGLFGAMLVALGRLGLGLEKQVLTSRYAIYPLLFWCSAIVPIYLFFGETSNFASWKMRLTWILVGLLSLTGFLVTAKRNYELIQATSKNFEIGKYAIYDYRGAEESDIKFLSWDPKAGVREKAAYLESKRLGPFAEGTGAEIVQRTLSTWEEEARHLNLQKVSLPAESILVQSEKTFEVTDDTLGVSCTNDRGISFRLKLNDEESPSMILIYSMKANHLYIQSKHFKRSEISHAYPLPLGDGWKVFRIVSPPNSRNFSFHLDYSVAAPFEDQLKITSLSNKS
jgi:hypothetical protein